MGIRTDPETLRRCLELAGEAAPPLAPKTAKYRNTPTRGYASKKEAKRGEELKLLEQAGVIQALREQVPFPFTIKGVLVCTYVADFVYLEPKGDLDTNWLVVEDVKSPATRKNRAYRIKVKLMKACYGVDVREV